MMHLVRFYKVSRCNLLQTVPETPGKPVVCSRDVSVLKLSDRLQQLYFTNLCSYIHFGLAQLKHYYTMHLRPYTNKIMFFSNETMGYRTLPLMIKVFWVLIHALH